MEPITLNITKTLTGKPLIKDLRCDRWLLDSGAAFGVVRSDMLDLFHGSVYLDKATMTGFGGSGVAPLRFWKTLYLVHNSNNFIKLKNFVAFCPDEFLYTIVVPTAVFNGNHIDWDMPESIKIHSKPEIVCHYLNKNSNGDYALLNLANFKNGTIDKSLLEVLCSTEEDEEDEYVYDVRE